MHIKSIALLVHNEDRVEVARGQFTDKGSDIDITHQESGMLFLQVKFSMTMKEKLGQVRSATCVKSQYLAQAIWPSKLVELSMSQDAPQSKWCPDRTGTVRRRYLPC